MYQGVECGNQPQRCPSNQKMPPEIHILASLVPVIEMIEDGLQNQTFEDTSCSTLHSLGLVLLSKDSTLP